MAEHKDYGLSGVHRTVQLGKQGPVLVGNADTDSFSVTLQDASTLTNMSGANATSGTHFITKSQLDSVYTEATFLANVNYNDTSPILLGNIASGTKTIITTLEVNTVFDANAVVTIGTTSDNDLLMGDSYAEIEVAGSYQTINVVELSANTTLNVYVTQGGASQGSGTVLVSVVDGPVVNAGTINYGSGSSSGSSSGTNVDSTQFTQTGTLSINTGTARWYAPQAVTITSVTPYVGVASLGSNILVNLRKNSSSTISAVEIAAGATSGSANTTQSSLSIGDYLTVDVTQVGSITKGSDLVMVVKYTL